MQIVYLHVEEISIFLVVCQASDCQEQDASISLQITSLLEIAALVGGNRIVSQNISVAGILQRSDRSRVHRLVVDQDFGYLFLVSLHILESDGNIGILAEAFIGGRVIVEGK